LLYLISMKKLTLSLLVILGIQITYAQKRFDPTPKDIALAKELRTKYHNDDIAILTSTESIDFDFNNSDKKVTVNQEKQELLININHRADISKYEFYDSESKIEKFNLEYRNGKKARFTVKDDFYNSNGLFYIDYRVKHMSFDFPVQGYTYNYKLKKKYDDVKYFTSIYFNNEYPVIEKKIKITIPEWLNIELKEMNFEGFDIKKSKKTASDGTSTTYIYTIKNIAASYKERSSPGPSYMYPHLLILAKSYIKNNKKNMLFDSTKDLYEWYRSLVNSVKENPGILKQKVTELTVNAKTDEEKIKNIYYWVQDNIRYIAFEDGLAGFRPDASQNVFQKRYGDCKGMANLTRQMLKEAGFDARLTWIGTKRIAYDYSIPSLSVDNHMICTLMKDGKKYFLDGTEKYNSFGEYANRIQGKEVMIEDGNNYIIEKVPTIPAIENKEIYTANFSIENENLTGKINGNLKGESRASFLYGYNNLKTDQKENALQYYLSRGDKNFIVSNINTSDLQNRDISLTLEHDITLQNRVSSFDNEIYIDLNYLKEFQSYDFKKRKTDFLFSYKRDYEYNIALTIPKGYTVSRIPEPVTIDTPDYTINVSYNLDDKNIIYKKHFIIKKGTIKKSDFLKWNTTITKLKKLYNDQITLTKL